MPRETCERGGSDRGSGMQAVTNAAGTARDTDPDRASDRIFNSDDYVPALLAVLSNALTSNGSTFYRGNFGVGLTDWRIMHRLAAEPGATAHQICARSMLDKGVVSRSIAWMEEQGIVVVENDAVDARRRRIALSRAGHDLFEQMSAVALAREENFIAVLSDAERATLIGLLKRLIGNLDAFSRPVPMPSRRPAAVQAPKRKAARKSGPSEP